MFVINITYFCFGVFRVSSGMITINETGIPYDVLVPYLSLCWSIIYIFNCYPRIPLIHVLFLVNDKPLIVYINCHEKMELHSNYSPRAKDTVTGF